MECEQWDTNLLDSDLATIALKTSLAGVFVSDFVEFGLQTELIPIVAVLVPRRDCVLRVIVLDDVFDGLGVRTLNNATQDRDLCEIMLL